MHIQCMWMSFMNTNVLLLFVSNICVYFAARFSSAFLRFIFNERKHIGEIELVWTSCFFFLFAPENTIVRCADLANSFKHHYSILIYND